MKHPKIKLCNKYGVGAYNPKNDSIYLGKPISEIKDEDDFILYYSDALVHEYMHSLLFNLFGKTTSKLFDIIEQHFRLEGIDELFEIIYRNCERMTWDNYIKKYGIVRFFQQYNITDEDFKITSYVANHRIF